MITNQQASTVLSEQNKPETAKIAYTSPVFRVFGSVSKLTMNVGTVAGDSGPLSMALSDPMAKENIVRVGEHPLGIGLYLFDYKPEYRNQYGYGRQFGVMADEVETVMSRAVCVHPDGYKMVDYGMLGVLRSIQ